MTKGLNPKSKKVMESIPIKDEKVDEDKEVTKNNLFFLGKI